jgi:hypothetical protein
MAAPTYYHSFGLEENLGHPNSQIQIPPGESPVHSGHTYGPATPVNMTGWASLPNLPPLILHAKPQEPPKQPKDLGSKIKLEELLRGQQYYFFDNKNYVKYYFDHIVGESVYVADNKQLEEPGFILVERPFRIEAFRIEPFNMTSATRKGGRRTKHRKQKRRRSSRRN